MDHLFSHPQALSRQDTLPTVLLMNVGSFFPGANSLLILCLLKPPTLQTYLPWSLGRELTFSTLRFTALLGDEGNEGIDKDFFK